MRFSIKRRMLGATLAIAMVGTAFAATAVDTGAILKERQATMKEQGRDVGYVKGFLDGKATQQAAEAGATDLTKTTRRIPDLFPAGTDQASPDGKYRPKPEVWTDRDKFLAAQKQAAAKADALLAAVKSGDKAAIKTAFTDLGKNGCGNCHTNFREKLKD